MPDKPVVYAPIPEFGELVEYIIQSAPVEQDDCIYFGIEINPIPLGVHDLDNDLVLEAVISDYKYVSNVGARKISSADAKALQNKLDSSGLDKTRIAITNQSLTDGKDAS